MRPGLTAVRYRLVERLQAAESFRPVRHACLQVLVEALVGSAPRLKILRAELFSEVCSDERVSIQGLPIVNPT